MAKDRLIGFDGKLSTAIFGAEVSTGTLSANTFYLVVTVGSSSTLPTGVEEKYVFLADGTEDITSSGDVVKEITFNDKCDITSWGLEFNASEVPVTTLCDDQNKYRAGRTDVTGSMEGNYTIGLTDADGGIANAFVDILRQAGAGGNVTIDKVDNDTIFAVLYKQKDTDSGETEQFYIAPITVTSFSDTVAGEDAQTFSSSFRIAPSDEVVFHLVSVTYA